MKGVIFDDIDGNNKKSSMKLTISIYSWKDGIVVVCILICVE